jgi:S-adenosylmethionine synthetase
VKLDTVVVSSQHAADIDLEAMLAPDIRDQVVAPELAGLGIDVSDYKLLVNPTGGSWSAGRWATRASPVGRSSSTRTAGSPGTAVARSRARTRRRSTAPRRTPCGGSRRTPSPRASRSGSRYRWPTRSARRPGGLFVETFGTENVDPARISSAITEVFDLRPAAIIRDLDLLRPIYAPTAAYGHFGRTDIELPWESTDRADALKSLAGG